LILLPRKVLVDQWIESAQEKFYGLGIMKNPTLSKMSIAEIRVSLKYSGAKGIAMTAHSFKNKVKKQYFSEKDFDLVIVDEAADLVVARDFIEGFRMSAYLTGLEEWKNLKIFLLPYQVKEKKIKDMVHKFNERLSVLIREYTSTEQLKYIIPDPIIIEDTLVNTFVGVLEEEYNKIKTNALKLLKRYGIKGYNENLETLLNPKVINRLKEIYKVKEEIIQQIQTHISKYILVQHIKKWFLYSNREELSRSILASQIEVERWLMQADKKLLKLAEVVKSLISQNKKIYLFSQYVATAELIQAYLKSRLELKKSEIILVTGKDQEVQYLKLENFKNKGKVLISTPVFDKGTDIPEVDVIIVYTPPLNKDSLFQVVGRIRGGEVIFLAYNGYEEEIINELVYSLRRELNAGELNGNSSNF
ncbi:MAG: helicase-related protein, partial [Methanosarcinales archaeon]